MRVCAPRLHWPEAGTTIAWSRLHDAVEALHGLVRVVDEHCYQAEQDSDLSAEGIARRRTELGRQALTEVASFKPFQTAEKATLNNIEVLEKKMVDLPQPPSTNADVPGQEIRAYIRQQKSPIDFVIKHLSNSRILAAVLTSEAFLSGLSDAEFNLVHERARTALHPVQADMQAKLTKALGELREGVAATKRMLLERCGMGEDDDQSAERTAHGATAAKSAAA
jgi:hypothetical protein